LIIRILAFVALIVIFTIFAVNNKGLVEVNLSPFAQQIEVRLFILIITSFALGLFMSCLAFKRNKSAKEKQSDQITIKALQNEIEALKLKKQIKKQL
jgi:uncharacterized integral membrane protein